MPSWATGPGRRRADDEHVPQHRSYHRGTSVVAYDWEHNEPTIARSPTRACSPRSPCAPSPATLTRRVSPVARSCTNTSIREVRVTRRRAVAAEIQTRRTARPRSSRVVSCCRYPARRRWRRSPASSRPSAGRARTRQPCRWCRRRPGWARDANATTRPSALSAG